MPQAFTAQQMDTIRQQLFQSACRHAITQGVKKTSLEQLTADAGISKSTFYKFYDCKEQLFLEVGMHIERQVIAETQRALHESAGQSSKRRTALAVNAAFDCLASLNALRFLKDDIPSLRDHFSQSDALEHYKSMSDSIFHTLKQEGVQFAFPDQVVSSVIHILYLSIQHAGEFDNFAAALRELVLSACDRLVA